MAGAGAGVAALRRPGEVPVQPLRIALQIERFSPGQGGAEGYARGLAAGLAALGQEVTAIAWEGSDPPAGVHLVRVRVPGHPKSLRALAYARGSARAALEGGYDIVHSLGKSLGMNVLNPHGGVEAVWLERERRSRPGRLPRWLWTLGRRLSPRHHVIQAVIRRQYADPRVRRYVALSRAIAEAMVRVHGVDPARIVVLPNTADAARFRPARDAAEKVGLRRKLGLPQERLVFLFVGNNFRLKGLRPLIEGLARLKGEAPPLLLAVLGRGDAPRYRELAARLGVEGLLEFRGPVSGIEEWYRAADGYLHPTFYDACSLALPEAMASGLPVLASRHDGSSERITEGVDGVLVDEPDDIGALAAGLRRFFDPAWRARVGQAARARALRDPPRDPAAEMLRVYREALSPLDAGAGLTIDPGSGA